MSCQSHRDLQNKSTATYPGYVLHPEETDDDVVVRRPGQKLHGHGAELLQSRFRPVLEAGLGTRDGALALAVAAAFHGDRKVLAGDTGQGNIYPFRQEVCVCVRVCG